MTESMLRVCRRCARYTLSIHCPVDGQETRTPHPARFSPQDRWGRYRRALAEAAGGSVERGSGGESA